MSYLEWLDLIWDVPQSCNPWSSGRPASRRRRLAVRQLSTASRAVEMLEIRTLLTASPVNDLFPVTTANDPVTIDVLQNDYVVPAELTYGSVNIITATSSGIAQTQTFADGSSYGVFGQQDYWVGSLGTEFAFSAAVMPFASLHNESTTRTITWGGEADGTHNQFALFKNGVMVAVATHATYQTVTGTVLGAPNFKLESGSFDAELIPYGAAGLAAGIPPHSHLHIGLNLEDGLYDPGDPPPTLNGAGGMTINPGDRSGYAIAGWQTNANTHGTVNWNGDHTKLVFTPAANYTGLASFTYQISIAGSVVTQPATVTINVTNSSPVFAAHQEDGPDDSFLDSDPEQTPSTEEIGKIVATDADGDSLTYAGTAPSFIQIAADGTVSVTDQAAMMSYFDSHDTLNIPITVTDGIATVSSFLLLNGTKDTGIIPARYMYVRDTAGTIYSPTDAASLKSALESIQAAHEQVDLMVVKGHGGDGACQLSATEWLTAEGGSIFFGDTEVTTLFKAVTDSNSKIYLRCCFSATVAKPLAETLDGARVWGARRYTINIPGTPFGLYAWKSYAND